MEIKRINSAQNAALKQTMKYRSRRGAETAGVFMAEGLRVVEEVLKAQEWSIESLWFEEGFLQELKTKTPAFFRLVHQGISRSKAPLYIVPPSLMKRLSDTETPQGVLTVVRRRQYQLTKVLEGLSHQPLILVLENLQDPGNVGTLLRTADSAGADAVLYTKGTADVYSPKVVRAAMGSLLHVPVCKIESVSSVKPLCQAQGIRLWGAHLNGSAYYFDQDLSQPAAIMIGNEGSGLSEEAAEAADALIRIPMLGRAESLNAGVAGGILLYEAIRQRQASGLFKAEPGKGLHLG